MANIYDYLKWRGDLEFDRDPFNPVDNVIFSQLSYLPMEGIVPGPDESGSISIGEAGKLAAKKYKNYRSGFSTDITITLGAKILHAIRNTPRYKDCKLFGFVNNIDFRQDKQFSAFCTKIERKNVPGDMLVVFRGTDMNLAGWKEDLNMSFNTSVAAQKEAVNYLEKMAGFSSDPLITAGHSKGGNLAIYASAFCEKSVQNRIRSIYSNDSPGFHRDIIQTKEYEAICGRIHAFIPQGAFVGMLLEHGETPSVIKSRGAGLLQHDMTTWEVTHNNFIEAELTQHSIFLNKVLHKWLYQIDEGQREQFVGILYKIITSGNAQSLNDFPADWINTAGSMINSVKNLDKNTKKLLLKIITDFYKAYFETIGENIGLIRSDKTTVEGKKL